MIKSKKSILVTGGAGYVGSVLVPKLVDLDYKVTVLDRFYFGTDSLSRVKRRISMINEDIRNLPAGIFKGIDTVIHLAGLSNDPMADFNPEANDRINTQATIETARASKLAGVKQFIFGSSCSIYDLEGKTSIGIRSEESRVNPVRYYSLSKYNAEQAILLLTDISFWVTILRKGTVFGLSPRMRFDLVVNTMVKSALETGKIELFSKGKQWRPLVEVGDAADAYIKVLESNKPTAGEIINIADKNYQIKKVAQIIKDTLAQKFGKNITIIESESNKPDRSYRVSTKKAKTLLNYHPRKSIDDSVVSIAGYILKNKIDTKNQIFYNIEWMKGHMDI